MRSPKQKSFILLNGSSMQCMNDFFTHVDEESEILYESNARELPHIARTCDIKDPAA